MFKLTWKSWLAVWVGLGVATLGLTLLIRAQGASGLAGWIDFAGGLLTTLWTLFGLVHWREVPWVKRVNAFVLTGVGFGFLILLFLALNWNPGVRTASYLLLAVMGFLVGINLLRLLLRPGYPILGVARTMIEEALRMGIALIFIVALFVMLVLMPIVLGSEDRVTYMVQRFLTYSTAVVSVLLGLMTVLLAARSVSLELSSRQAHMTLTKPLTRWQYLLGKWLGVVLLDAVLVAVAGVAIYGFTMGIARNPALNDLDRYEVDREVLTARLSRNPDPIEGTWQEMYDYVLAEKQLRDPGKFGEPGDPIGALAASARQEVLADTVSRFYSVKGGTQQDYRFTGLARAAQAAEQAIADGRAMLQQDAGLTAQQAQEYVAYVIGRPNKLGQDAIDKVSMDQFDALKRILEREVIQLVLTPKISPSPADNLGELSLRINGQPWPPPARANAPPTRNKLVLETPNEIPIPASLIKADGTLVVTVEVPAKRADGVDQPFIQFTYKDAQIDLFYRVGSFENNLARAMLVTWLKLCFLAMLGLVAGSLLSFPVAAMLGLVVYVTAAASGVIDESLSSYASVGRGDGTWDIVTGTLAGLWGYIASGEVYDAFKMLLRLIGETFMLLVPSFGAFGVTEQLSEGEVIGSELVVGAALKIGLLWTGVVGLIGLALFSRKEIARVTV